MQNNEIQVFTFETNEIRTMMIDNEPWFVAKDVAEILGYSLAEQMTRRLDHNEKTTTTFRGSGSNYQTNITIINESGLYKAILRSNKPEAKVFQTWVTSEVLPAIRKHGGYMIAKEGESVEEVTLRALTIATEAIKRLSAKIEADKPLVEFATQVSDASDCMDMNTFAKIIHNKCNDLGRNKLYSWLRKNGFLQKNNIPYQRFIASGIFKVKERTYTVNGTIHVDGVTYVTGKGQMYIFKELKREFGIQEELFSLQREEEVK